MFTSTISGKSKKATLKTAVALLAVLFLAIPGMGLLSIDLGQASDGVSGDDDDDQWSGPNLCSRTAMAAFRAANNEIKDDYWIAVGNCNNESDAEERAECLEDAKAEYEEAQELTRDQREARLELCEDLGESAYDPELNIEDFVDIDSGNANPYFPLVAGTKWVYYAYEEKGGEPVERITVRVMYDIKTIEYPEESGQRFECVVVNDLVEECEDNYKDGVLAVGECSKIEDTDDWYAQDDEGNVWYMGEIARDFEEDLDGNPELVEIEGAWKAGLDAAKPGILMYGNPDPENEDQQNPYRQEFALGNAEDIGEVLELVDIGDLDSDKIPPGFTITGPILITKDSTPIEPDVYELKYYAPGIGMFREENPDTGEYVELVEKSLF